LPFTHTLLPAHKPHPAGTNRRIWLVRCQRRAGRRQDGTTRRERGRFERGDGLMPSPVAVTSCRQDADQQEDRMLAYDALQRLGGLAWAASCRTRTSSPASTLLHSSMDVTGVGRDQDVIQDSRKQREPDRGDDGSHTHPPPPARTHTHTPPHFHLFHDRTWRCFRCVNCSVAAPFANYLARCATYLCVLHTFYTRHLHYRNYLRSMYRCYHLALAPYTYGWWL